MTTYVLILVVLIIGLWWAAVEGPLRNPSDTLLDFYEARDRGEDQLIDPLILNGHRVAPLVIAEVSSKEMKLRCYAISFLGNGQYRDALPVLEQILADESELYYFRADALEAIFQILPNRAHELAPRYVTGEDLLGQVAQDILAGRDPVGWSRSYWQAFLHVHE